MKHQNLRKTFRLGLLAASLIAAMPAMGQTTNWVGGAYGLWEKVFNWDHGVPGSIPSINLDATIIGNYQVILGELSNSSMIGNLLIEDPSGGFSSVAQLSILPYSDFSFSAQHITVGGSGSGWGRLTIGGASESSATLNVVANLVIGDAGNGDVYAGYGDTQSTMQVGGQLLLGNQSSGIGTFTSGRNDLTTASTIVGNLGTGTFTQDATLPAGSPSRHSTNLLTIGAQAGSSGSYVLNGASNEALLTIDGTQAGGGGTIVGMAGSGEFRQKGGTHTISGGISAPTHPIGFAELVGLDIGSLSGSYGNYVLEGGVLQVDNITVVGNQGEGHFEQYAGTSFTTGSLYVGFNSDPGASGTYVLAGGDLKTTGFEVIGGKDYNNTAGSGSFYQNGGHNQSGGLWLGDNVEANGYYVLNDGNLDVGAWDVVGVRGTGYFSQYGGTHNASGNLDIAAMGTGSYYLAGGELHVAGNAIVGDFGYGYFTQIGGKHAVGKNLVLGAFGRGVYGMTGGELQVAGDTIVGDKGFGIFTQSGGSLHTVGGNLIVGASPYGYTSSYTLSDPTSVLTVAHDTVVGAQAGMGTGVFTNQGGSHTTQNLIIGDAGTGTYNLKAGTTTVTSNMKVGAHGTFNHSGGGLSVGAGAGTLTNEGQVNLSGAGTRTVDANVVNNGGFKVTGTTVIYTGAFTDNGVYISDPATNVFSQTLTVNASGYLVGGTGDVFQINGDFLNYSTRNLLWNTDAATLTFGAGVHNVITGSADLGGSGFAHNFAWGVLELGNGTILDLANGSTLYVGVLDLAGNDLSLLGEIHGTGVTIFYNPSLAGNDYLKGQPHTLGGITLMPLTGAVPEPETYAMLLAGLGLSGYMVRRRRAVEPST